MAQLRLEPFGARHLDGVAVLLADSDVMRFTAIDVPPPEGFAQDWLAGYERGLQDGTRSGFAAMSADDEFLGLALAVRVDRVAREAELGYMVVPAARGKGVGAQILELLTEWAFEEAGVLRAELLIDVANAGSEGVARRCGYVREGVLRSRYLKQDIRIDAGIWSRLASDPR